ncbi:hypothetical protein ACX80W_02165 [Arthrobacter sp. TMN-37]
MDPLFEFAGNFWWLVFPLSGVFAAWGRSWSHASERRHQRKVELHTLRHRGEQVRQARTAEVEAVMGDHDAVNRKWLDYELDVGKLIDFPLMTDVREPLTVAFLRAKRTADALRPADPGQLGTTEFAEYRSAVNDYAVAFQIAEAEAHRLRDTAFTGPERQRLARARNLLALALDSAASSAERQTAYRRARRELDGLIVLPDTAVASLEAKVARMIDSGPGSSATA